MPPRRNDTQANPGPAFITLSSESFLLMAHEVKTPPCTCWGVKQPLQVQGGVWFRNRNRCAVSRGTGPILDFYFPGHF